MNRRSFLKRCSLLPFLGSLATVGDSGASEGKKKELSDAETILKAEWRDKYHENVSIARRACAAYGGDNYIKYLEANNLGNTRFIRSFYNYGKQILL